MSNPPDTPPTVRTGVLALIMLVLLTGVGIGAIVCGSRLTVKPSVNVVQAAQDLPPLTVITRSHVMTGTLSANQAKGAVTDINEAIGQVTTSAVAKGAALPKTALLTLPADRWLLSVPISETLPPIVGERVALLGIRPDIGAAALAIDDAIIVSVKNGMILVAVTPDQAAMAAPYLLEPRRLMVIRRLK